MKGVPIGIIGGTGGIGRWFAGFFHELGYAVEVSGRKSGLSPAAMAAACAVVIVSVPMDVTGEVIRKAGPLMKRESLLMDFTSLKEEPVRDMLACSTAEVIGCHPLFGPGVRSLSGQNIVICPGRGRRWLPWLRDLFRKNGARVMETTPQHHDYIMAMVQGLNHLNTISLGLALRQLGANPLELENFSTPAFRTKMNLIDKVFRRPGGLYAEIIARNPNSSEMIAVYEKTVSELKKMIRARDATALRNVLYASSGKKKRKK